MGSEHVKNEIRRFLSSKQTLALCLRGKWGVGKTYTWDNLLAEAFKASTVQPKKYSYVSLFGLETLSSVRKSIFEHTVGESYYSEKKPLESSFSSISERIAQVSSKWRGVVSKIRGVPIIADYGGLMEIGFLDVKDQIVCFDDLERMSNDLSLKDVLGLISFLKEKKNCKVVLLLNDNALEGEDAEDFRTQLEKVVDVNLEYNPSSYEAITTAIPDRSKLRDGCVAENATTLGITNLRTIFKLLQICERFEDVLKDYDERVLKQAFHSACLFGFALYQPDEAPSLKDITETNYYASLLGDQAALTPEQIQHAELLRVYKFTSCDNFDHVVLNSISSGFYVDEMIKREADLISDRLKLIDHDAAFTKTWDIYHNSFDDNGDEFAQALKRSIVDNAAAISRINLSSSVSILKQLGYSEGINDLISAYVEARSDGKEFWVKDTMFPMENEQDPDVDAAFAKKAAEFKGTRTVEEVAASIVADGGWNDDDVDLLDQHTADDYYDAIKRSRGENLSRVVRGLTYFRRVNTADSRLPSITAKAIDALNRLGEESEINRLRVRKFGIEVPSEVND